MFPRGKRLVYLLTVLGLSLKMGSVMYSAGSSSSSREQYLQEPPQLGGGSGCNAVTGMASNSTGNVKV